MRSGLALNAVIVAALLLTACGARTVGSAIVGSGTTATAGTGTATPASSTTPTPAASTTNSAPSPPAPTPPPVLPASGTGAYGYVMAGPTCPVERPDRPCPPRPVSETITVRTASGATVASTHSDAHGRYAIDLTPGTYTLVVATGSILPRCPDTRVTVNPGSATRADISCDTGIR